MNREEFILECSKIGIKVTDEQLLLLDKYYKLLIEWNNKINLTAITEENEVYLKHFYDSLTLYKTIDLNKSIKVCDVGSGAGFPGIVLKIFFKDLDIVLVDSLQKRVNYLNEVINSLGLKGIYAIHSRMEDYSKTHIEEFDVITARAVAKIGILSEIAVKALKVNGYLIFMKGNAREEIEVFSKKSDLLGLSLNETVEFLLPFENSNRTLVKYKKIFKTKDKYPRRMEIIKKEYMS